jgi:L-seryl-tRNA(Ser) seleniumtransferase
VHLSNFKQEGFVHQPTLRELQALATERGVPVLADLGSGSLGGDRDEPTVQEYLSEGADVVTFSGDKLLGGPQAGLLAGRAGLVERCRRHPLARALRLDKTAVAALHATAAAHACGEVVPLHARMVLSGSRAAGAGGGDRGASWGGRRRACATARRRLAGGRCRGR